MLNISSCCGCQDYERHGRCRRGNKGHSRFNQASSFDASPHTPLLPVAVIARVYDQNGDHVIATARLTDRHLPVPEACFTTDLRKAVAAEVHFKCTELDLVGATMEVAWGSEELEEHQWPTGQALKALSIAQVQNDQPKDAAGCKSPELAFRTLTGSRSVGKALRNTQDANMIYCRIVLGTWCLTHCRVADRAPSVCRPEACRSPRGAAGWYVCCCF
jgi:hypothetical protein